MSKDKFLGKVSRRRFLAGTAGVLGATSAASGLDRKDPEHPVYAGFVIGCRLNRCPVCGRVAHLRDSAECRGRYLAFAGSEP